MPNVAPDSFVERFRDDVRALIGVENSVSAVFGVAVSGGPDSMALLSLASRAFPGRVNAATVDHGLRPEARTEAEMVGTWCAKADVDHVVLTPEVPIKGSIQAAARMTRYRLLHSWREEQKIDWLLTAHHADDQLETMLMRLNRASGVGGLSSIRARNGFVLRPLLAWRRVELAAIVDEQNIPSVQDPSNSNDRFDRVIIRNHLRGVEWIDPVAVNRSAGACADADEALAWLIDGLAKDHIQQQSGGVVVLEKSDFPREIQRRLIVKMLDIVAPDAPPPRGDSVDQALVQLCCGKKVSIGDWLLMGGDKWTLCPAPPRGR